LRIEQRQKSSQSSVVHDHPKANPGYIFIGAVVVAFGHTGSSNSVIPADWKHIGDVQ
jgi:hypothetical protein